MPDETTHPTHHERIDRLTSEFHELKADVRDIKTALIGDVNSSKQPLIARVNINTVATQRNEQMIVETNRRLEATRDSLAKAIWTALIAALGTIATAIFTMIRTSGTPHQ